MKCKNSFSFSGVFLLVKDQYIYIYNFCMPNGCCWSVCCLFSITSVIPKPFLQFTSLRFSSLVSHPVLSDSRLLKVTCFGVKGPSLIILQVDSTCDLFQKSVILHFMDAL